MKSLLLILLPLSIQAAEISEETITHANTRFRIVRIAPGDLQLVWKNDQGQPYRSFSAVQSAFAAKGKTVKFLINAGIFEPGGIPSGLHVEDGKDLLPLNRKQGEGNFYLQPNGILSLWTGRDGGPHLSTVDAWIYQVDLASKVRDHRAPVFAIQSGPLLLSGGQRHPAFKNGSANKLLRNGVGIDPQQRFVFAITAPGETVNFWDFAGLFLQLGCQQALFLDGSISQMAVNPAKPIDSNPFAAIFIVAE